MTLRGPTRRPQFDFPGCLCQNSLEALLRSHFSNPGVDVTKIVAIFMQTEWTAVRHMSVPTCQVGSDSLSGSFYTCIVGIVFKRRVVVFDFLVSSP